MKLYRISATKHIKDLTGTGARIYGGRWNYPGFPVVYTSSSRSLAALEFLVHVPMALAPKNLSIAVIETPEQTHMKEITSSDLPKNWRTYPPPGQLAETGTEWLKSKSSLLLKIPSAVMQEEYNILINSMHEEMNLVTIESIEKFSFDSRFLKNK